MDFKERHAQARALYDEGQRRVRDLPVPRGQKFAPGARVRIADDLGPTMSHFPKGRLATVLHTYAHAYGGDDVKSYCLDVDGVSASSWYYEHQLTLVEDDVLSQEFIDDAPPPHA